MTKRGLEAIEWDGEIRQYVPLDVETFVSQLRSPFTIRVPAPLRARPPLGLGPSRSAGFEAAAPDRAGW
jgi:hypothetical protein